MKQVKFKSEAREALFDGIEILSNSVASTLGPGGRNVVLKKYMRFPLSTKDGVTVAKHIILQDTLKNMGAEMVKEAAIRTNEIAGDGTTTSTLLAYNMVKDGMKLIDEDTRTPLLRIFNPVKKEEPVDLARGMELAKNKAVELIKVNSIPVKIQDIKDIAIISANNDPEIGNVVYEAYRKIGLDCLINVETHKGLKTELEIANGMELSKGWYAMDFVTNPSTLEAEYSDANVILTDLEISDAAQLAQAMDNVLSKSNRPIVLFAKDFIGEAISSLIMNRRSKNLKILCVQVPGNAEEEKEYLEDISKLTGAKIISEDNGLRLFDVNYTDHVGRIRSIKSDKNKTVIISEPERHKAIEKHASMLEGRIEKAVSEEEKNNLRQRISRVKGSIAVIKVGGKSDLEKKEQYDRFVDAVSAAKAAVREGILPGGGAAYYKIAEQMEIDSGIHRTGFNLVRNAMKMCMIKILENASYKDSEIKGIVKNMKDSNFFTTFDSKASLWGDAVDLGVIDPAMVSRVALENAVSVAKTIILTDAVVYYPDNPEEFDFKKQSSEI